VTNQVSSSTELEKAGELLAKKVIFSKARLQKKTFWSAWHFLAIRFYGWKREISVYLTVIRCINT